MKMVTFENIYNKEKFYISCKKDVRIIDGIECWKVFKKDTKREVLVRKDFLKKVNS